MPRARLISDGGRTVSRTLAGAVRRNNFGASGRRGRTRPTASLTTALAGTHNDLVYRAKVAGAAGNSIQVAYLGNAGTVERDVTVSGSTINVQLATTAGAVRATETAAAILNAIRNDIEARNLVDVSLASGNDGTGVLVAMAATNLTGGSDTTT